MQNQVKDVTPVQTKKLSLRDKALFASAVGTTYALAAMPAHAASSLTSIGDAMTVEIDGAKAIVIALFTAAAVVLAIFVGWKYLKRGGNSA